MCWNMSNHVEELSLQKLTFLEAECGTRTWGLGLEVQFVFFFFLVWFDNCVYYCVGGGEKVVNICIWLCLCPCLSLSLSLSLYLSGIMKF